MEFVILAFTMLENLYCMSTVGPLGFAWRSCTQVRTPKRPPDDGKVVKRLVVSFSKTLGPNT